MRQGPEDNDKAQSLAWRLLSAFARAFLQSFFRTVVFISYFAFSLSAFVTTPEPIFLFAVPLSLIGLWLLLYHFDLVSQAAKRHVTTNAD